jgi:hypothetical protein
MKLLRIGATKGMQFILLKNIDDVRRYVDNYSSSFTRDQGLGDLSQLSIEAQSVLLKFVEETVTDICCFASRDNVNPVLMSRFDVIEKYEDMKIGSDSFDAFSKLQEEKEYTDAVLEREFVAKAPQHLDSFLVYRRLSKGMKSRVGHLL